MIRLHAERDDPEASEAVFRRFRDLGPRAAISTVANTWIEVLLDHGREGDAIHTDSRALHEFAQTKIRLAQETRDRQRRAWREAYRRLLVEARGLLERVIQMDAPPTRHAWAWRDLARTLNWLRAPESDVLAAFEHALRLLPGESRFEEELDRFRQRQNRRNHRTARGGRNGRRKR